MKLSKEDYEALADSYEREPARRDEMMGGPLSAATLRIGRPRGRKVRQGTSPTRTIRLAAELDGRLVTHAEREHVNPSEIVRRALDDYLGRAGA